MLAVAKDAEHAGNAENITKNEKLIIAIKAIKDTGWVPAKGETRIASMIANRPDWCISRQRSWGLPIPAFTDGKHTLLTAASVRAVSWP